MQNPNALLWPRAAANDADPEGLGTVIEAEARLWNHLLDANRSLWSFYTPWLQAGPSLWGATVPPLEHDDRGEEPAQTADGIPDALESQARAWNRYLDANRSFWTTFGWPAVGAWNGEVDPTAATPAPTRHAPARKTARKTARSARAR